MASAAEAARFPPAKQRALVIVLLIAGLALVASSADPSLLVPTKTIPPATTGLP